MTSHVYITINLFNLCQHFFLPFDTYFSKCWHSLNEPKEYTTYRNTNHIGKTITFINQFKIKG